MADHNVASRNDRILAGLLRGLGAVDLLAVAVVFLSDEAIDTVIRSAGLDPLPVSPVVGYLIRSTSVLYALHGALLLGMAADVVRYRTLIRLLGWLAMIHGGLLFSIDLQADLPGWWRTVEGPTFALCGLAIVILSGDRVTDA